MKRLYARLVLWLIRPALDELKQTGRLVSVQTFVSSSNLKPRSVPQSPEHSVSLTLADEGFAGGRQTPAIQARDGEYETKRLRQTTLGEEPSEDLALLGPRRLVADRKS